MTSELQKRHDSAVFMELNDTLTVIQNNLKDNHKLIVTVLVKAWTVGRLQLINLSLTGTERESESKDQMS